MPVFPARWLSSLTLAFAFLGGFPSIALSQAKSLAGSPMHSISLTSAWLSPNSDSTNTISYSLTLDAPGRLIVEVGIPGDSNVLRTVQNDSLPPGPRPPGPSWDGRQDDGSVVTDGPYEFRFTFVDTLQNVFTNLRQFVVDTVAPVIDMVTIDPRIFTPTILGSLQDVVTGFTVTQSVPEDTVAVYLDNPDTLLIEIDGGFQGNGSYDAPCIDCSAVLSDGIWNIAIIAFDRAGNVTAVADSFDANLLGPDVSIQFPTGSSTFVTQQADSIVGLVLDRQPIAVVTMMVSGALDSTLVLVASPGVDSTQFQVDVSQLFAAEGTYDLLFPSIDVDGVSDSTRTLTYTVDRTLPPAPILSPPLSPIVRATEIPVTVLVDSTANLLHIEGAAITIVPITIAGQTSIGITLPLSPGANMLVFFVEDFAGNLSTAVTVDVFRETSEGLSAPEHFRSGSEISIDAGSQANSVVVRIMALDGSVVRIFKDSQAAREFSFLWDLTTPEGRRVRNGPYLVMARVTYSNGATQRYRKMIAVIE